MQINIMDTASVKLGLLELTWPYGLKIFQTTLRNCCINQPSIRIYRKPWMRRGARWQLRPCVTSSSASNADAFTMAVAGTIIFRSASYVQEAWSRPYMQSAMIARNGKTAIYARHAESCTAKEETATDSMTRRICRQASLNHRDII